MKKADIFIILGVIVFFAPFFLFDSVFNFYWETNKEFPYLMSYIKFAILATFGEVLGLRIRKGVYNEKGFGIIPRAIVWGFLGMTVKIAFVIFAVGAPEMLRTMGMNIPADILNQDLSLLKFFVAFMISFTMNLIYAPLLMVTHKITDEHIIQNGGTFSGLFKPFWFGHYLINLNWRVQWEFTFKRVIPFFWIPAQTVNFLFPSEVRILVAALYGIILGVLLAIASQKSK